MNRVLLIIGGLLVGLLAALFIVPVFVDWTRYRGYFEEEATRLLGRDVRVGGRVNMRLLPIPYVRFERVRIADTQAALGEPLFRADEFTIWLAVGPLLGGELQASEVELKRPVVTLVLDEAGSGNWSGLADKRRGPASAFAPSAVSLEQVRVTNGAIAILSSNGREQTRFEHINGELSAAALEGPYRLTAAYSHQGAPRELRLATARTEADGSVRFKGSVRAPQSGASTTMDGIATDIFRKLQIQGELTAKLPLAALLPQSAAGAPAAIAQPAPAGTGDAVYDLKAQLSADTSGATIKDLSLSFEQDGKPQLAVGSARLGWQQQAVSQIELSSRWLDLDRVGARGDKTALPDLLSRFLQALDAAIGKDGQTVIDVALDQASLGGDIVSGVKARLERRNGPLAVRVAAAVPGGSRFDGAGIVTSSNPDSWLAGEFSLRGGSLLRFNGWALRNTPLAGYKQDGPFAISGRMALGASRISARDLVARFAGNNLSGEAAYGWAGGGRQLTLALDGGDVDATPLIGDRATPLAALAALAAQLAPAGQSSIAATSSARARLKIGRLTAGRTTLKDLEADVAFQDGQLSLPMLRFGSDDTHLLELSGDVAGLLKPDARGSIRFLAAARTRADLDELLTAVDAAKLAAPLVARAAEAGLPMRIAGNFALGSASTESADITFDGSLQSTRVAGSVRSSGKAVGWRESQLDISLALEGEDAASLLGLVKGEKPAPVAAAARAPASFTIRSVGSPKAGLVSLAALTTQTTVGEYRGRLIVDDTATVATDGLIRISTGNLAQLLGELGLPDRGSAAGMAGNLAGRVTGSLSHLKLDGMELALGELSGRGKLELDRRQARPKLTGQLTLDRVSAPQLLAALTTQRGVQSASITARPSLWSEDAIDLTPIATLDASIALDAAKIEVAPDISLRQAKAELLVKDSRFILQINDGTAAEGKITATVALERAPAGARAKVDARITGARLEVLGTAPKPTASGIAQVTLSMDSAGLSPRGLVAALKGKGELKLQRGALNRLSPKGMREATIAFLALKGQPQRPELQKLLEIQLAAGSVQLGDRTLAIEVADGIVRLAPITLSGADGALSGTTHLDIEAMRIDSEWRIEAAALETGAPRLPAMSVVFAGPVNALTRIEPKLDFDALEREITVRRMERELRELEQLRKLDEERAKAESERQRQLETERALLQQPPAPPQDAAAPAASPPVITAPLPIPPSGPATPAQPAAPLPKQGLAPEPAPAAGQTNEPAIIAPAGVNAPTPDAAGPPAQKQPRPAQPPPRRDVFRELGRSAP